MVDEDEKISRFIHEIRPKFRPYFLGLHTLVTYMMLVFELRLMPRRQLDLVGREPKVDLDMLLVVVQEVINSISLIAKPIMGESRRVTGQEE